MYDYFLGLLKTSLFMQKLLRLLFRQILEQLGYFLFQHLFTLSSYLGVGRPVDYLSSLR